MSKGDLYDLEKVNKAIKPDWQQQAFDDYEDIMREDDPMREDDQERQDDYER